MKKHFILIALGIMVYGAGVLNAQEPAVEEIVRKANLASYYAGKDGMSDVRMTITDSQGRKRNREFRILRYDVEDGGEQKFYVHFNKPADVAKMVFMVWKHMGKDDDRWLYLPALDLVKRIAASDKRSSFAGSHFVYEDVSGRSIEADTHELVGEEDGKYKIKNLPKETAGIEFAYYFIWIDKNSFLPVKAEYYDKSDKLIKVIEALEVTDVQGNPTVIRSRAADIAAGGETLMEFTNSAYDVGLTDDIFEERYLRRAPSKWVKQ